MCCKKDDPNTVNPPLQYSVRTVTYGVFTTDDIPNATSMIHLCFECKDK